MCIQYFRCLEHLLNHLASVDDTETTTLRTPISQDHSKSILSGLGEIVMSICGGGSSDGYGCAVIEKIQKKLHLLQQNEIL